ncbi:SPOR domain-containing protein [Sphingomonas sp. Leaf25]|uniref:SPOR domain-containing protein n=1 Tax=Sphingomonas sp. Leaf25 TaxID=1735692 RepID=UPI0006FEE9DD|nr:SPOR domain-containing protein [Sphingomonas sp. Leaf25]KQN04011.1 hypothetical protein ASE78_02940 [Sphingomonas sp. Leaf25]
MIVPLMIVALAAGAQDTPPVHEARLDDIGRAGRTNGSGVFVVHRSLAPDSFVEVTALDTGRIILAAVRAGAPLPPDRVADLSPAAAAALGLPDVALVAIRIRPVTPTPQDQTVLRAGGVVARLDAPQPLLVALRRRLPTTARPSREMLRASVSPPARTPKPFRPAAPVVVAAPATGQWFVQVAALSDGPRAEQLANSVGGVVRRTGTLYRVQAGPFATRAAADTARASLVRRGFGDARMIAPN